MAFTVTTGDEATRSGLPKLHSFPSLNERAGGMSAGLPIGAPLSTQRAIFPISSSLSDVSSLNFWMPMFRSMNHGGISRTEVFRLIDRAHGRASSYVMSDIGPMPPGRWQV